MWSMCYIIVVLATVAFTAKGLSINSHHIHKQYRSSMTHSSTIGRQQQSTRMRMSTETTSYLDGYRVSTNDFYEPKKATKSKVDDTQKKIKTDTNTDKQIVEKEPNHYESVIVGGGPAGLLSAIMMAQRLQSSATTSSSTKSIVVYDRLSPPPPADDPIYAAESSKYYLLGLGHRGQKALNHFNVWKEVEEASVAVYGRRGWEPGQTREEDGKITLVNKSVTSRVLPRDKLVSVLKKVIEDRFGDIIDLKYGYQVDPISFGDDEGSSVELQVSRCIPLSSDEEECDVESSSRTISTNFLIGADGAARTIANAMEENSIKQQAQSNILSRLFGSKKELPFKVTRYEDDNPRVYKSIPIKFPQHWPSDLNYSAASFGRRITLEALPSDANGNYCALLLMKPKDELAAANCDAKELRSFFDQEFPQFSKLVNDDVMADVAKKGASSLPSFRFAGPRLHEGGRTVLLGDSIHTVKPYFGLGANTALEDVQLLSDILNKTPNLSEAVQDFTKQRAGDAKALVKISRGIDRPGKLGTLQFILPLILDSIFHKLAPKIFGENIFGMFKKEGITFVEIQRKKRLDRMMQATVILSGMSLFGVGVRTLIKSLARLLGVKDIVVGACMVALLGVVAAVKKVSPSTGSNPDPMKHPSYTLGGQKAYSRKEGKTTVDGVTLG